MSISAIITILEKLATLHDYLYELTVRKADIVKNNSLEDLQNLNKEEQKFLKAISQLEQQRLALSNNKTISELMVVATDEEKTALLQLKDRLSISIEQIQEQNDLNQQLLQQSLQFIAVTLNTLTQEPSAVTYEKSANIKKNTNTPTRSMFDSKA
ncbi:flagellar biosynthesis/type III secretory pathway chaperone [Bacillus tianshenii]|uniref:Flagellar biosynthesis/type III secretory pathway chaperone n=1 Tax=Sutcliffiella tianshenii TaxID=1463404 RepID=A0ABS2NUN5_9BACI|nr:flagellar export chaperone FlgN [Bacillus tianshenii]MBM7618370.1 flagellar biosynthesis/type III secretory pathway chaperone [Bacillus tianshenii]